MTDGQIMKKVRDILSRDNTVEIKRNRAGAIIILEVEKKMVKMESKQ